MAKTQLVSIVIPVFNEEDGIAQLKDKLLQLRGLLAHEFDLEFVFVDDGSHDRTVERLKEQFVPGQTPCQVIEHRTNQGVGAAFRTGFRHSNGLLVCTIDADCTYSPEGLRSLLTALRDTGSDISVASPYHPKGGVEGVPAWRLLLSQGCSALYRWLSPLKLYTYTSIFRVYKSEVVRTVPFKSNGFVSAAEILIAAGRQGYKVTEVPMVLRARAIGRSKMKVMRTVVTHLKMLASFVLPRSANAARRADVTRDVTRDLSSTQVSQPE
jgi:dolichol-phosphate mannosyltransferase